MGTYSNLTVVNVATTSTALMGAASSRIALIISGPQTNRFSLSINATAVLDQGITLYASGAPLILTVQDHGDIVTRAWSAISATGAQNVTFISVFDAGK